ncbi:MAG: hypothetical protein IPQ08_05775 [Chitinophagaceae bacterium]|nr:hypothetical protein [Chitinophagaceae bacterium]
MGLSKNIETPELMWELFEEYTHNTKDKPIEVQDFVGKDGEEVYRKKERPLTMEGFENYCFRKGVISDLSHYFSNKDGRYADFVAICRTIRKIIRQDQIEGGMSGIYNPSITQRLNGLVDKVQEDGTKEIVVKVKYDRKGIGDNIGGAARGAIEGTGGGEEV